MTRGKKGIDAVIRLVEQTAQGREQGDVLAKKEEVIHVALASLTQRQRGSGHGGFKTEAKEDHLPLRVLLRQLQRIHR